MLNDHFDVTVQSAESHDEAIRMAAKSTYNLVLLNRIYDATGTEGMDTLRALKSDEATRETPVMLVSNFQESQDAAVAEGATPGFGKAALADPATVDRLKEFLAD